MKRHQKALIEPVSDAQWNLRPLNSSVLAEPIERERKKLIVQNIHDTYNNQVFH